MINTSGKSATDGGTGIATILEGDNESASPIATPMKKQEEEEESGNASGNASNTVALPSITGSPKKSEKSDKKKKSNSTRTTSSRKVDNRKTSGKSIQVVSNQAK